MTDAGAFDVDLFVIGGGSGGVRAARIAAGHGARVMLAEEFRLGGTCVIRGCVPKKLYVMASRMPGLIAEAAGFGFDVAAPTFDWPKLVAAKEKEITRLEGLYHRGQESAGVTVVASRAVLEDAHMARLADGRRVRARMILIATGGRPFVPDIPGAAHAITSNDIFDLPEFPRRLVVMGGGYIAMEFACAFAGLGAEVSVVHRGQNILRGFDEDIRDHVRAACEQRGIRFFFEDIVTEINPGTGDSRLVARTAKGLSIDADQVLFATGRVANTAAMGLEEAGVRLGKNGEILVDAASRTSVPHIYAVGDVTDRVNLTPVAIREGHAFADSVFGNTPWNADYTLVPTAVFTTPEIGTVGMTEAEALAKFADINVFSAKFRPMRVTLSGGSETTFMKLIVDAKTDRILGAHLCGENAGEMIQLVGITLKMGATKAQFDATMAVHPTAAEELVTMRSPTRRFRAGVPA